MASTSSPAQQSEIETTNAFDGIAVPSASSPTFKKLPCSVFINHRGPDVKETLAKSIYHALHVRGIGVFLDSEELVLGDNIPTALQKEMSSASLHIAIFSPTYAQSAWCLAELSFMLQTGKPIIPVFYGVHPADVRWVDKGAFAEAFAKHELKGRYSEQKLNEWKRALHNVSLHKGQIIIDSNDGERDGLKNIVNRVLKEMKVSLSVAKYPVGLDDSVTGFEKFVQESEFLGHNRVRIIGIWGMGGVGKTTLAKELYNKKHLNIDYSSFVFGIREAASENKLHERQRGLLEELGVVNLPYFDNIEDGKKILSNCLRSVRPIRVLIVLDDVDCPAQLDALLPMKDSFAWGSLILVTTREREVLQCCSITSIYKMEPMNHFYAEKLFCWHAFKRPSPGPGFEELVAKFTNACNRLPLSLEVIGSMLLCCSEKRELWEDLLHKISRTLPTNIKDCLRVSYDALDAEEKQIFVDAACFFVGENCRKAIAVWEGSEWSGLYGLKRLLSKCLLDLDDKNCITMHDHLRDLGREIATTQLPYRLCSPNQIAEIQKQYQEEIPIRGMILNTADKDENTFPSFFLNTRRPFLGFLSSTRRYFSFQPQVFVFKGNHKDQIPIIGSSTELLWLSCTGITDRNLPLTMENLRVLDLHHCWKLVRLWSDGPGAPWQLRMLTIDGCPILQRIPKSIGLLKNLTHVSLSCNSKLKGLPEEFCCLQSLEHLQLTYCCNLNVLPNSFSELGKLRHLDLSGLRNLRMLPDSFKRLKLLQHLNLKGCCRLCVQPDIMQNMTCLEYFNINGCSELKELSIHITNQVDLKELYAEYICLRRLPMDIGKLSNLRVMKIASQALAESFGDLNNLEHLELTSLEVDSLPESFKQLNNLQTLKIRKSRIRELDFERGEYTSSLCNLQKIKLSETELCRISISEECCPRLKIVKVLWGSCLREAEILPTTVEEIDIQDCPELITFLISAKPAALKTIDLYHLQKIKKIENLQGCTSLEQMTIRDCPQLNALPIFGRLVSLKKLVLEGLHKIESIDGLQQCTSLEYLTISDSPQLSVLSCFEKLASLYYVSLLSLPKIEKIEGLQHCTSLKDIRIISCPELNVLPCFEKLASLNKVVLESLDKIKEIEGFQHCTSLRDVSIISCPQLSVLLSFEKIASLNNFELMNLPKIEKIDGLQNCTSLNYITIMDCPQLSVLVCFGNSASLREFRVKKCKKVVKLECLQHCSALRELEVENTCLGVPSIESSGQMQVLEPCIPEKQKCPARLGVIIHTRAMRDMVSVINPSDFPSLPVIRSFQKKKIPSFRSSRNACLTLKGRGKCSSKWNTAMLYLVINCVSLSRNSHIWLDGGYSFRQVEMEDGKWILITLFSPVKSERVSMRKADSTGSIEVEKGMLLIGDENDVREAFWRTVARVGH